MDKANSNMSVASCDSRTTVVTVLSTPTNTLMCSIQLGMHHSIGGLASKPMVDLLMVHFNAIDSQDFATGGSSLTPAHDYGDFAFRTYAPLAFRHFRSQFGIDVSDFMLSICSEKLRELSNPGASGSIFYLTHDDEFIMKTVQKKESRFLQHLLPGYYMNLIQNKNTLLPKFFGLYCYEHIFHRRKIRIVVMNNLLPSCITYHEKYDLKGSTFKRFASDKELGKKSPTLKDLDFLKNHPDGITLAIDVHVSLMESIRRDTTLLESFAIMDYSMLLGVHNIDEEMRHRVAERRKLRANECLEEECVSPSKPSTTKKTPTPESAPDSPKRRAPRQISIQRSTSSGKLTETGLSLLTHNDSAGAPVTPPARSTPRLNSRRQTFSVLGNTAPSLDDPFPDVDYYVPPGGIPARNSRGDRLLLFVGIIDVLQSYKLRKKVEHGFKSILADPDTVSVHRPSFYANRFRNFMTNSIFTCAPVRRKSRSLSFPPSDGNSPAPLHASISSSATVTGGGGGGGGPSTESNT